MKKNTLIYLLSLSFLFGAAIFQTIPVFASYITTVTTISIPGAPYELLYKGADGNLAAVPNTFATTTSGGVLNVNVGAYASYPNPSGMFNTYDESLVNPILASSFMGSTSQYVQIFGQNLNPQGSMDLVFSDDKGTATSTEHYVDFGIANSKQLDPTLPIIAPLDAYIFSKTNRLIIGTGGSNASSTVVISAGMGTSTYTRFDEYGHLVTHGLKPTLTGAAACSLTATSDDQSGTINCTGILSITTLTLTFKNPYQAAEVQCSLNSKNNITLGGYTSTVSALTMPTTVGLGGGSFTYQCQATE